MINEDSMGFKMTLRKHNARPKGALSLVELYSHCLANIVHHICCNSSVETFIFAISEYKYLVGFL